MGLVLGLGRRQDYIDGKGPNKFKGATGKGKKGKRGKHGSGHAQHDRMMHKAGWPSVPIAGVVDVGGQ